MPEEIKQLTKKENWAKQRLFAVNKKKKYLLYSILFSDTLCDYLFKYITTSLIQVNLGF